MHQYHISIELGKTTPETHEMLQTCDGDKALSSIQTFLWCQCFQEAEEDVEHDPHSG
jgi:hypothetical protein